MKPSPLTNEYLAAAVTGMIRAVLGEVLAAIPPVTLVISATTDGFLSNLPEHQIPELTRGPLCQLFAQARSLIAGDSDVLAIKHRARQVMSWRTRGVATLEPDEQENELVLARAGIRTPEGALVDQNEFIVTRFIGRQFGEAFTNTRLRNARELCFDGGDFVNEEVVVRHRMDYDWKRRPRAVDERPINNQLHVCFDTSPLRDRAEFEDLRERWDDFYNKYKQPLKRASDLDDFGQHLSVRRSGKLQLPQKGAAVYVARKMFLVAYTHSQWGLRCTLSNAELAGLLSKEGFPTTVREVENAKRAETPLYEHSVLATEAVERFCQTLLRLFPGLEEGRLLATVPDAAVPPVPDAAVPPVPPVPPVPWPFSRKESCYGKDAGYVDDNPNLGGDAKHEENGGLRGFLAPASPTKTVAAACPKEPARSAQPPRENVAQQGRSATTAPVGAP